MNDLNTIVDLVAEIDNLIINTCINLDLQSTISDFYITVNEGCPCIEIKHVLWEDGNNVIIQEQLRETIIDELEKYIKFLQTLVVRMNTGKGEIE